MNTLSTLDTLAHEIEQELRSAYEQRNSSDQAFDVRGKLYQLGALVAQSSMRHPRQQDLDTVLDWVRPQSHESGLDVAAGGGFISRVLVPECKTLYALDPSAEQIRHLEENCAGLGIQSIIGSLSSSATLKHLEGQLDFATSFGGIHHVEDIQGRDEQLALFQNVGRALSPGGRFVAADVGEATPTAHYFEQVVKKYCVTGHTEKWLNPERLQYLADNSGLELVRCELVGVQWVYESRQQMQLFFKGMLADVRDLDAIDRDLERILGVEERAASLHVNWPMLFWDMRKPHL